MDSNIEQIGSNKLLCLTTEVSRDMTQFHYDWTMKFIITCFSVDRVICQTTARDTSARKT